MVLGFICGFGMMLFCFWMCYIVCKNEDNDKK